MSWLRTAFNPADKLCPNCGEYKAIRRGDDWYCQACGASNVDTTVRIPKSAAHSICAWCGKDMGEVTGFSRDTHGICPRCVAKLNHENFGDSFPEWYIKGLDGPQQEPPKGGD